MYFVREECNGLKDSAKYAMYAIYCLEDKALCSLYGKTVTVLWTVQYVVRREINDVIVFRKVQYIIEKWKSDVAICYIEQYFVRWEALLPSIIWSNTL